MADLTGRTLDLAIFDGIESPALTQVRLGFVTPNGAAVVGMQFAAQYFILSFLGGVGTTKGEPNHGTNFVDAARAGIIRTDSDVELFFVQAADDILEYQNENLTGEEPDDEILTVITLVSFTLAPPNLYLKVALTSQAGESREIILPVKAVEV